MWWVGGGAELTTKLVQSWTLFTVDLIKAMMIFDPKENNFPYKWQDPQLAYHFDMEMLVRFD